MMKMLTEIGSIDNVEDYINKKIENKEKIVSLSGSNEWYFSRDYAYMKDVRRKHGR